MNFLENDRVSKVYAYYMISTLILRIIAAGFFAYALWSMYTSMKDMETLRESVNGNSFITHFCSMLIYIIGKSL